MAKRSSGNRAYQDPHSDLFAPTEDRRRRHLFLPSVLDKTAKDMRLATRERGAAYEIILPCSRTGIVNGYFGDSKVSRQSAQRAGGSEAPPVI